MGGVYNRTAALCPPAAMLGADSAPAAFPATISYPPVWAYGGAFTWLALITSAAVLADAAPSALLARDALSIVLTDARASTWLASLTSAAVFADAFAPA